MTSTTKTGIDGFIADTEGFYSTVRPVTENELFGFVSSLLERRMIRTDFISSPEHARNFLISNLGLHESEVFSVIFLDNRHRIISYEELFFGTIDGASVHPREVVKRALFHNAAAVILAHNHPSGDPTPSQADRQLTERLRDALNLVDTRVLDHIVVGGNSTISFTEIGMI